MGLFDVVWVPCPVCGKFEEFQSKSGPCLLDEYNMDDAPPSVLAGLGKHPEECKDCGTRFGVDVYVSVESFVWE